MRTKMSSRPPSVGAAAAPAHLTDLRRHFADNSPPAVLREPLADHAFLNTTKARIALLPPALNAAGLPGLPYTRYHEIAAVMQPKEIHSDVVELLDGLLKAFGR